MKGKLAMTRTCWINLPVADVNRSKAFFAKLGFSFAPSPPGMEDTLVCLLVGENKVMVNLIVQPMFEGFANGKTSKEGTEVLFSIGAATRDEVDALQKRAAEAGATVFAKAGEKDGWMYGCGFCDLDGHRWNVLYMNESQATAR